MAKGPALFALMCCCIVSLASAQEDSREVRLPDQGYSAAYEAVVNAAQEENNQSPAWLRFRETYGEWHAFWNDWNRTPMRVWGEGYQVPGVGTVTAENVDGVARVFLRTVSDLLRCTVDDLEFVDANQYEGKWAVSYRQVYKGIPVLFSDVTVRMTDGGRVFLFGSEFQPELAVSTVPVLPSATANALAATGLTLSPTAAAGIEYRGTAILPRKSAEGITQHLAYEFFIPEDDAHLWHSWVDAHTGTVLWRYNQVIDGIGGSMTTSVKESAYTQSSPTIQPNAFQYVKVNNVNATTNAAGQFTSTNSGSAVAKFEGPYCKISRQDGTNSSVTQTIANNGTFNLEWNNTNSTASERTAFYSVNRGRSYIVDMDPSITSLDYQVLTKVNMTSTCNANFDGNGLNFYRSGTAAGYGTCPNAAEMADVVLHEYGHLVNAKVYIQFGKSSGMSNSALHEALADGNACLILDRPEMGLGFFGASYILRNLNNNNRYPTDISGESHYDGLIMGGAIWDMRLGIGLALAGHHVQFARHAKPDDTNTGKAYTKFFLEVMAVDDNDANLANGTPNASLIVPAFAKHGIPSGMLSITHTKVSDQAANATVAISCSVTSALSSITTQSVQVYYRPHGGTWSQSPLTMTGGSPGGTSDWAGGIPRQPAGTIVEYYLEATEAWGTSMTLPAAAPAKPYMYLVGFISYLQQNFESANGWVGHFGSDDAMTGRWIMAAPIGTSVNSLPVQTSADHSATGTKCWVTGNGTSGGAVGDQDVDDGTTTVLSPAFDMSTLGTPVIRYWRWYTNNMGSEPGTDTWIVQISSDDGNTWTDVENSHESFNYWSENIIPVSDYVTPSTQVRMHFVASDLDPQSLVEAALDDFEILYVQNIPVELASFSASRIDGDVAVGWTTASETNNHGFTVQYRMATGGDWTNAGFVPGHGTSFSEHAYRFSFAERSGAPILVRLRQEDADGSVDYSSVLSVSGSPAGFAIGALYPNPASTRTTVEFETPGEMQIDIVVTNTLGVEVLHRQAGSLQAGSHAVALDLSSLPAGLYSCSINGNGRTVSRTLLKTR